MRGYPRIWGRLRSETQIYCGVGPGDAWELPEPVPRRVQRGWDLTVTWDLVKPAPAFVSCVRREDTDSRTRLAGQGHRCFDGPQRERGPHGVLEPVRTLSRPYEWVRLDAFLQLSLESADLLLPEVVAGEVVDNGIANLEEQ